MEWQKKKNISRQQPSSFNTFIYAVLKNDRLERRCCAVFRPEYAILIHHDLTPQKLTY